MENQTPYHLESEQSILGPILIDGNCYVEALDCAITQEDFYRPSHRTLWGAYEALFSEGKLIDVITVSDYLERHQLLESVGGPSYLATLMDGVPYKTNIPAYAEIVKRHSMWRRLISAGERLQSYGYKANGVPPEQVINGAVSYLLNMIETRPNSKVVTLNEAVAASLTALERSRNHGFNGISTGLSELDRVILGMRPGQLIIVAGRPQMGKTALATGIGFSVAEEGKTPLVFSLEMTKEQLTNRLLARASRISLSKIISGYMTDDEYIRVLECAKELPGETLMIDDTPGISENDIRARALRIQPDLVIVDYLQLISPSNQKQDRERQIASISWSMKMLAKELNVPVILVSQLNRKVEDRKDKRPILSDLRESGAIEQDADVVLFIYRDEIYDQETENKGIAEIIIGKQREGRPGFVETYYQSEITTFKDLK